MKDIRNIQSENCEEHIEKDIRFGISLRAALIALGMVVLISAFTIKSDSFSLFPSIQVRQVPSPVGIFLMVMLMLINILTRRFKGKNIFSRADVLMVYILSAVGTVVGGMGLMSSLIFNVMSIPYGALNFSHPAFIDMMNRPLAKFIHPMDELAYAGFMFGQSDVPWSEWVLPIITWTLFFLLYFFVVLCLCTIVRRHWNEAEQLRYPLVMPILAMTETDEKGSYLNAFWTNKLAWLGMGVCFIYFGINGLNRYFPVVPRIPSLIIQPWDYMETGTALRLALQDEPGLAFRLGSPLWVGIGFLISAQLNFSIWIFAILNRVVFFLAMLTRPDPMEIYRLRLLGTGAHEQGSRVGYTIALLWVMRKEIIKIVRGAFTGVKESQGDEALSYKVAILGFVFGFGALILFFTTFLTANFIVALYFAIIAISAMFALSRMRAELGLPFYVYDGGRLLDPINETLGKQIMDSSSAAFRGYVYPWASFGALAPLTMEGYRMADEVNIKKKTLTKYIFLSIGVGMIVAWITGLKDVYNYGGLFSSGWSQLCYKNGYELVRRRDTGTYRWVETIQWFRIIFLTGGVGIGATLLLMKLHTMYIWWPLHPVGYVLATYLPTTSTWSHLFTAWLAKSLINRWGGPKLIQKLTPFFLGLIVGEAIMTTFWNMISILIGF